MQPTPEDGLSIGAVSQAADIPVATLRTWERRYGFPEAVRRPSGHRRYPVEVVDRLRRVKELLARGHKPSAVLTATPEALDALRRLDDGRLVPPPPAPRRIADLGEWFDAVDRADADALERILHEGWSRHGHVDFLDGPVTRFLVRVGERWRSGSLGVGHEHLASQVVGGFLANQRRAVRPRPGSPVVVCATLSGERHELGVQMAAAALALASWDVRFLGCDTPPASVADVASAADARAVCIGSAPGALADAFADQLLALRAGLGPGVRLWVGGAPVPPAAAGVATAVGSIAELVAVSASARGPLGA